nr:hypothetical protein [Bombilactobacillus apium]
MEIAQTKPQVAHPTGAILGLMIGAFVGMFSETSLNIALPFSNDGPQSQSGNDSVANHRLYVNYWNLYASFQLTE